MKSQLIAAWVAGLILAATSAAAEPQFRIDLQRETKQKVPVAIPEFFLDENYQDLQGLGKESRDILENDLKLSELFKIVNPVKYEDLLPPLRKGGKVDLFRWRQVGARWMVKTRYRVRPRDGVFTITFRVYDTAQGRFLLGKRYTATKKFLRKIIHRFADEMVMQLTGKRGVAETKIAFLSFVEGDKELFTVDFDGENLKQLTEEKTVIMSPAWSPDGWWIVYTSFAARNPDLVMIRSSGRKRRTLLKLPGLNAAPSWSPDGQRIALVLSKDQNSEIYVLQKNFGLKRLTRHFNIDTSPTWSPDGTKIAFTSDRSGTAAPQIYIMNGQGGDRNGVKRITFGSSYNDNPTWSPDGDKIAYTSRVGRKFQIMIYDLESQKNIQFTSEPGSNEQPTWSPDGRFLAFRHKEAGREQIYIKRLGSSRSRSLTFLGGGGYSPAWSPFLR